MRLAWVTAREARGRDDDEPLALAALDRLGVDVEVVDWDDPDVDWSAFDRAALRSAWDYPQRMPEFLAWLDRIDAATELVNPPAPVRWSMDKKYLAELEEAGVPITPTVFVPPGTDPAFPDGEFVVKPSVGAGSVDAASYGPDDHDTARSHVARLHAADVLVLVQPFIASVATDGEWPMVFFHGTFSHTASKRVALPRAGSVDDLFAQETNTSFDATPDQVAAAQQAVDVVTARFGSLAYTRIDLVRADDGSYCVLEVELVEPSLFLLQADAAAADRLAAALTR